MKIESKPPKERLCEIPELRSLLQDVDSANFQLVDKELSDPRSYMPVVENLPVLQLHIPVELGQILLEHQAAIASVLQGQILYIEICSLDTRPIRMSCG